MDDVAGTESADFEAQDAEEAARVQGVVEACIDAFFHAVDAFLAEDPEAYATARTDLARRLMAGPDGVA